MVTGRQTRSIPQLQIIFKIFFTNVFNHSKTESMLLRSIGEFIKERLLTKKYYLSSMEKEVPRAEGDEKLVFFFLLTMVMAARTITVSK